MKKTVSLIMCFLLLVLTACSSHEHKWKDANCTEPRTCTECGVTEGDPLGHEWKDASCTEPRTCTKCGATEGNPLGHEWKDASCTEPKTCTKCGATEGNPLGHSTPKLSCTEGDKCERCGQEIAALGHEWKDASCTEPKTCSRCGSTEGEALGHQPGEAKKEVKSAATCTADGIYDEVVYCTRCNAELSRETKTEPALGHSTDNGKCSRCGLEVYALISGSGDDVVSGIELGDGIYRAHITNNGARNFVIWSYDKNDDRDLLVNEIGSYNGYVYLEGTSPLSLEVESSGFWTIQVERLAQTDLKEFSGTGDYVTEICSITSGTYHFTYNGTSNFVIWIYTTGGRDLLVNEIGSYDGKKIVKIPSGSKAFFVINASGNWKIEKIE